MVGAGEAMTGDGGCWRALVELELVTLALSATQPSSALALGRSHVGVRIGALAVLGLARHQSGRRSMHIGGVSQYRVSGTLPPPGLGDAARSCLALTAQRRHEAPTRPEPNHSKPNHRDSPTTPIPRPALPILRVLPRSIPVSPTVLNSGHRHHVQKQLRQRLGHIVSSNTGSPQHQQRLGPRHSRP